MARHFAATPLPPSGFLKDLVLPIDMRTAVPGPASRQALEDLRAIGSDAGGAVQFCCDFQRSLGNYLVDADGNRMLDLFGHIASIPVGYNHPTLVAAHQDPLMQAVSTNRATLGFLPPADWGNILRSTVQSMAPAGMGNVQTMACGSCANENAYKAAIIRFRALQRKAEGRGSLEFSEEELSSCMVNALPGAAQDLVILSFDGGFHGRTFGALSTTRSKAIHKLDVPAFDWPCAPFPRLTYPLEDNLEANAAEERRCLERTEETILEQAMKGRHVAGVVIEPVQSEGGDNHAGAAFFRGVQDLCKKHGAAFIVDEVQTGMGASGRLWAFEHWGLESPPDMMTFSKKAQVAGYFFTDDFRAEAPYRIFNTWMGDPAKVLLCGAIMEVVRKEGLLALCASSGERLRGELHAAARKHPQAVANVRGVGTICAFDCPAGGAFRDRLQKELRNRGCLLGVSGTATVRFRPMLIFSPDHVDQFAEVFHDVLQKLAL